MLLCIIHKPTLGRMENWSLQANYDITVKIRLQYALVYNTQANFRENGKLEFTSKL